VRLGKFKVKILKTCYPSIFIKYNRERKREQRERKRERGTERQRDRRIERHREKFG